MAQYLVLIYGNETKFVQAGEEVYSSVMKGHEKFGTANAAAMLGGNALQPTATATSIRADDDGGFIITDGPFVETKEALAGYYLIEAPDLDEATRIAKQVPAPYGGLEVRPILVFD